MVRTFSDFFFPWLGALRDSHILHLVSGNWRLENITVIKKRNVVDESDKKADVFQYCGCKQISTTLLLNYDGEKELVIRTVSELLLRPTESSSEESFLENCDY